MKLSESSDLMLWYMVFGKYEKSRYFTVNLPTTCNCVCAVRVENDGASAVTSHEKLPDSPNPTLRITTWLAFDIDNWTKKNKQMYRITMNECWIYLSIRRTKEQQQ